MFSRLWMLGWLLLGFHIVAVAQPTIGNEWIDYNKTYYKFPVREQRFYRIPLTTLTAAGLGNTPVENFQLWRDGQEVPLYTSVSAGVLPVNGFIEFFGRPNTGLLDKELYADPGYHTNPDRSFFGDTAWYFLTVNPTGNNKRFSQVDNLVNETQLPADSFYMQTIDPLAGTLGFNYGKARVINGNFFYTSTWDPGEGFASGYFNSDSRIVEFNLTGLRAFVNGQAPGLKYAIAGNTDASRQAILSINNGAFDSVFIDKFDLKIKTFDTISRSFIINDAINFKFRSNNPIWFENVTVNQFLFTYPRQFFYNQQVPLQFSLPSNPMGNHLRIAALPNAGIAPVMYDLTNLKRYTGVIKGDSSLFLLEPSTTERQLVVGTQVAAHLRNITLLRPVTFRNFLQPINQGDYIIISHPLLRAGATDQVEAYRSYRSSPQGGNYQAHIYDINELADQFAYGVRKHPLAIRRFLMYAIDHFQQTPRMVLLIGRGTTYFEYWRYYYNGAEVLNTVPTWGYPGSDNLLAARFNNLPFPEIPIGRVAAVNPQEVKVYLDKVKDYEALQNTFPALPSDNEWRKRAIHLLGGNDVNNSNLIRPFLKGAEQIFESPKIGAIVDHFERNENPRFANDMKFIEDRIAEGASMIYFYGHSSSSSIDFNLNSPELLNFKKGKYPVFIANGCLAGNIFNLDGARLNNKEVTGSDNFTFATSAGSIAFISNSGLGNYNYYDRLSRNFYASASQGKFNRPLGEIQQNALKSTFLSYPAGDWRNELNIQQNIFQGDPAVVLFPASKPDYAVEVKYMNTIPGKTITELDSIDLKVQYFNLGQAVADSVVLTIDRELPDGTARTLLNQKIPNVFNHDSLTIRLGLKGLFEEGDGYFIARMDPANQWQEEDKDNNVAVLPFKVERSHIMPVYPYNYAIVNAPRVTLKASTTDPVFSSMRYKIEMDTTANFNSPLHIVHETETEGGVIDWEPDQNLLPNTVYYWRAGVGNPDLYGEPQLFSFTYIPGNKVGFNQSHYFQHLGSQGNQIRLDADRLWRYMDKLQNIYAAQGIYPSSGTEDTHFSITVNGQMNIRSACLGQSIIFNLFDSASFANIPNDPGGSYGSGPVCGPYRQFNFEYKYFNHTNRKLIMDFIDGIPKGTYVAARLVVDPPYDSLQVRYWMRDTLIYGSGNSLYHTLKRNGFYDIDSLNRTRTFFFMFRKDDSLTFKPVSRFSRGVSDRVYASVYPTTIDTLGTISSPWMGPGKSWSRLEWRATPNPGATVEPNVNLEVWGKTDKGAMVKLKVFKTLSGEMNIEDIPASVYPMLQLRFTTSGAYGSQAAQLDYWRVFYEPIPDGALSGKDQFTLYKSLLRPDGDTLRLELAFKNSSDYFLDSTRAQITLVDGQGQKIPFYATTLPALPGGGITTLVMDTIVSLLEGDYKMMVEVNEAGNPREQAYFNNRALIPFQVFRGALPIGLLGFNAVLQEENVLINWEVSQEDQVTNYQVEHSRDGRSFAPVGSLKPVLQPGLPRGSYRFLHLDPGPGTHYYRLLIRKAGGELQYSAIKNVIVTAKNRVKIAPNPFTHYFILQPLSNSNAWQIRITDAAGRIVKMEKGVGQKRIDMTDQAKGSYWVEWISRQEKQTTQIIKQ